jgi:16S rRNA (cytosine967-C5)-methyltransferase
VFPEENQQQVAAFLAAVPAAKLQQQTQLLPNAQHDGFFYALLEKPLA